jgi:hypothetical protein
LRPKHYQKRKWDCPDPEMAATANPAPNYLRVSEIEFRSKFCSFPH